MSEFEDAVALAKKVTKRRRPAYSSNPDLQLLAREFLALVEREEKLRKLAEAATEFVKPQKKGWEFFTALTELMPEHYA